MLVSQKGAKSNTMIRRFHLLLWRSPRLRALNIMLNHARDAAHIRALEPSLARALSSPRELERETGSSSGRPSKEPSLPLSRGSWHLTPFQTMLKFAESLGEMAAYWNQFLLRSECNEIFIEHDTDVRNSVFRFSRKPTWNSERKSN